jgi:THUMP domain
MQFAVLYDARANAGIDSMKIINAVAKSVPKPHKVDLSNPDKTVVVQIAKACYSKSLVNLPSIPMEVILNALEISQYPLNFNKMRNILSHWTRNQRNGIVKVNQENFDRLAINEVLKEYIKIPFS